MPVIKGCPPRRGRDVLPFLQARESRRPKILRPLRRRARAELSLVRRKGRARRAVLRRVRKVARRTSKTPPPSDPRSYTPKHLAEKILTSRSALEGERKQVTVLFADVKGSMDLAEQ